VTRKCSKCHSLERVYRAFKSDESWAKTINKMALLDSPNITSFDVKQVLNFLRAQQKKQAGKDECQCVENNRKNSGISKMQYLS